MWVVNPGGFCSKTCMRKDNRIQLWFDLAGHPTEEETKNSDTVAEEVSGGGYVKVVGFKAVFEQRVEMGYTKIN